MSAHEDFTRKHDVKSSSDRSFGFVFTAFFLLIGLAPLRKGLPVRTWALVVAGVFLLVAVLRPRLLRLMNVAWTKLALLLSRVTTPIFTGLQFYLIFTPLAFFLRLAGKDVLRLRFDSQAGSYWIARTPVGPAPESMSRQF